MVEPLPLVPATWKTGGRGRSGLPGALSRASIRPSDRSMLLGCSRPRPASAASRAGFGIVIYLGTLLGGLLVALGSAGLLRLGCRHRHDFGGRVGPLQEAQQ